MTAEDAMKIGAGMNLRSKLIEYHGSNRATFECPEGHRFKCDVLPRSPLGQAPGEPIIARIVRYWQNTGVRVDCPRCKRLRR